uniref:Polypeptide N-acetylgalactosaminyltransferase n=1 Tax=Heterorhabditis bacteriophora TaxID=37862 RepID=A0A1I7XN58_HETBA
MWKLCRLRMLIALLLIGWVAGITYLMTTGFQDREITDNKLEISGFGGKVAQFEKLRQKLISTKKPLSHLKEIVVEPPTSQKLLVNTIIHPKPQPVVSWREFDKNKYLEKGLWREGEDKYAANKFNQAASDAEKVDREIQDSREHHCKTLAYNKSLMEPTTVIVTYHNEARSTLLRTVFSALLRSPSDLLKEIILVDDFSNDGLIRSRVKGASLATAPILTFLDSHVECNVGWLEPLLTRIHEVLIGISCLNGNFLLEDLRKTDMLILLIPSDNGSLCSISERLALRQKLQCKSFEWYLKEIYPELKVPEKDRGQLLHVRNGILCLDSLGRKAGEPPGVYQCHGTGGNQEWAYEQEAGYLRSTISKLCIAMEEERERATVLLKGCNELKSRFRLDMTSGWLTQDGRCLTIVARNEEWYLSSLPCDASNGYQRWIFEKAAGFGV